MNKIICKCHSYEDSPRYLPYYPRMISQNRMMHIFRGSVFYLRIYLLSFIFLHIPFHSFIYLSMYSVLSTIVQKGGDCWCNSCPSCVLEIVDRNRLGLICLLVHTERNSPCSAKENVVSGVQFDELHQRTSAPQRRMSYIL